MTEIMRPVHWTSPDTIGCEAEHPRKAAPFSLPELQQLILANHYTHSLPSGRSWFYQYEGAIVVFSIPANFNISKWLVGEPKSVLELTRLWAPDGHERNLLTQAIAFAVRHLRRDAPGYAALISYADPNEQPSKPAHQGYVYRAAGWKYLGQSEEGRFFRDAQTGQIYPRRKFHMGRRFLRDSEIVALGYVKEIKPGKHRYARGLTPRARRLIDLRGLACKSR